MNRQRCFARLLGLVALWGVPLEAMANAGVPMLMLAWPAYILALLPIIAVESHFGAKHLNVAWRDLLPAVAVANLWSTFVGIPLAWAAMFIVEMIVGIGSSSLNIPDSAQKWLFPFYAAWVTAESPWQVYAAFVVLAVPFCAISIWIERRIIARKLPQHPVAATRSWVMRANIWTYVLMVLVSVTFPILA
jgi:hypothetical protein